MRAAQPVRLLGGADGINRIRDVLRESGDRIRTTVGQPLADGAWKGEASKAALVHIGRVQKQLADTVEVVGQAGSEVMRFADALADAKKLVDRADDIANRERLTIGDDGSIHFPSFATPPSGAEEQAMRAAAEETHRLLGRALTIAAEADTACARALAAAVGGRIGSVLAGE